MNNIDLCEMWFLNKTINPINNHKIKLNAKSYKYFEKICSNKTINPKTFICDKWFSNKTKNPITNGVIKQNGSDYNKYSNFCTNDDITDRVNYFITVNNYINKIKKEFKNNCLEKRNDTLYLGKYIILDKQIGFGTYSHVYHGYYKTNEIKNIDFAVKICEMTEDHKNEIIIGEKINKLLINMKCPHFLFSYGYLTCKKNDFSAYIIINELAENTLSNFIFNTFSLYEKIKDQKDKYYKLMKNTFIQIYLSMIFFNNYTNYIHGDTKINNFLYRKINEGGYFYYKLFGIDYYLENIGYLWVINDFGLASKSNSKKKDLILFTNFIINEIIKDFDTLFNDDINNFFKDLLKLLKKKTSTINDVIVFIHSLNELITNRPINIINKNPYILE
jgi:hypothetical protein